MIYNSHRLIPRPIPTTASIAIITAKIITANKEIAKAFNHPESKKCFTKITSDEKRQKIEIDEKKMGTL